MKKLFVAMVALSFSGSVALAWSEQTINLVDPAGSPGDGIVQMVRAEGYFCADRKNAEVLSAHFSGRKVASEVLMFTLRDCVPDVRSVAGIFPQGKPYTVIFVKSLENLTRGFYLVPGLLSSMRIERASTE